MRLATLLVLMVLSALEGMAQSRHLRLGDEAYAVMAYAQAVPHYQKAADKGEAQALYKLARCQYLLRNYGEALQVYEQVMADPDKPVAAWFEYGHVLLQEQRYEEAAKVFAKYSELRPDDPMGERFATALANRNQWAEDSARYTLLQLPFNSKAADFGAYPYADGVVFASGRASGYTDHRDAGLDRHFLNLYHVRIRDVTQNKWDNDTPLRGNLRSRYHESSFSVSPAGQGEAWFSRTEVTRGNKIGSSEILHLQLFSVQMKGLEGDSVKPFPHNDPAFNLTHPSISRDGLRLYFAADLPGGQGGKDIWVSEKENDVWQAPRNLGPVVNTSGDEAFPYEHVNGTLYFASNGHPGMGHLDLFSWNPDRSPFPENLGKPLNSAYDDFAFYLNDGENYGYFSSNRPGGRGDDDVYAFRMAHPEVEFLVIDSVSKLPISAARIAWVDMQGKRLGAYETDWTGHVSFSIRPNQPYDFVVKTTEFEDVTVQVRPGENSQQYRFRVALYNPPPALTAMVVDEKSRKGITGASVMVYPIGKVDTLYRESDLYGRISAKLQPRNEYEMVIHKEGYYTVRDTFSTTHNSYDGDTIIPMKLIPVEVGEVFVLRDIHYDYGRWELRPEAKAELDRLARLMQDNPGISIELSSHTDSRGTSGFNQQLSDKRARSAVAYLVSQKNIPLQRISSRGYGEERLVNRCSDGVECSEEEHFENRRTEFTVTGYDGKIERR